MIGNQAFWQTEKPEGGGYMAEILGSIISNLIKMVILGAVAVVGVICGRKFRDKKDAEKAAQSAAGDKQE